MKKFLTVLILCAVLNTSAFERNAIIDSSTIDPIFNQLGVFDFIVFDLDNTVMEAEYPEEANCQWCDVAENRLQAKGFSKAEAFKKMVAGYLHFNEQAKMVATEECVITFIREAQNRGIPVIAITGRPDMMRDVTVKHLFSIGVSFLRGHFKGYDFVQANGTHFIDGIIYNGYAGLPQKGESLALFLKTMGLAPKNIVMIDDRGHCIESVQNHLPNINVIGLRYAKCDERFKNFKPTQAMLDYIDELASL